MHKEVEKFQSNKEDMKRAWATDEMGEVYNGWKELERFQNAVDSGVT